MPGNRWTKPQIESLVDQIVHLGKPLPQIDIPGKTRAAINNQRKRLQRGGVLNGSFAGRAVRPWTFPELKKLTGFTHDYGFSASFIAQMALLPGRTKDSISKMMGRHGLGNPAIKERARQAQRFDPPRREEFQRRLGIQLSWREARSSDDFRRQQRKRAAAFVAHTRARWKQWRERKKLAWEKLRQQLSQRPDRPPARVCQACGEPWYAAREFFHVRTRRSPAGVKISYCRICRLCRAERRRNPAAAHPATPGNDTASWAIAARA